MKKLVKIVIIVIIGLGSLFGIYGIVFLTHILDPLLFYRCPEREVFGTTATVCGSVKMNAMGYAVYLSGHSLFSDSGKYELEKQTYERLNIKSDSGKFVSYFISNSTKNSFILSNPDVIEQYKFVRLDSTTSDSSGIIGTWGITDADKPTYYEMACFFKRTEYYTCTQNPLEPPVEPLNYSLIKNSFDFLAHAEFYENGIYVINGTIPISLYGGDNSKVIYRWIEVPGIPIGFVYDLAWDKETIFSDEGFEISNPTAGKYVRIDKSILNKGNGTAPRFLVEVEIKDSSSEVVEKFEYSYGGGSGKKISDTYAFDIEWIPPKKDVYTLIFTVDPKNNVIEIDETNNIVIEKITVE